MQTRLLLRMDGSFEIRRSTRTAGRAADGEWPLQLERRRQPHHAGCRRLGPAVPGRRGRLLQLNRDGSAPAWNAPSACSRCNPRNDRRAHVPASRACWPHWHWLPALAGRPARRSPPSTAAAPTRRWCAACSRMCGRCSRPPMPAGQPIDGLIVPGQSFVMRFDGARCRCTGGCNTMNGSWRLSPQGQLMVGRLAATMKACEAPLMKADSALSAVLAQPLNVELQPGAAPSLRLVSPSRADAGARRAADAGKPVRRGHAHLPRGGGADGALPARRRRADTMPAGARAPLRQARPAHRAARRVARLLRRHRRLHAHARRAQRAAHQPLQAQPRCRQTPRPTCTCSTWWSSPRLVKP